MSVSRRAIFFTFKFPSNETQVNQLLHRWNSYGKIFSSLNYLDDCRIIVFLPSSIHCNKDLFPMLNFYEFHDSRFEDIFKVRFVWRLIQSNPKTSFTIVSGISPFEMIASSITKLRFGNRIQLQTQFHGDIYSLRHNISLKGFIKVACSNIAILFSDSIRVVSIFQEREIKSKWFLKKITFSVAPIPIQREKISISRSPSTPPLISIVGRLHKERGTPEMLEIVEKICQRIPEVHFEIVGNGPLRHKVISLMEKFPDRIDYQGHQNSEFLRLVYGRSRLLLSSAPTEGYGLVLREAILSGVKVVARNCAGVQELEREFPSSIFRYNSVTEAVKLLTAELQSETTENSQLELILSQEEKDNQAIKDWVSSWGI
jgi:glycosyltransferase involved in cell wall biosynthesis